MSKGLFIVFEGNNGAGKTTIINEVLKQIQNQKIIHDEYNNGPQGRNIPIYSWNVYKFPNRDTVLGKKIDDFLKKKIKLSKSAELKFFADNRTEFKDEIEHILNKGYNVICDRYVYSSIAYTLTNQTLDILNENIKQIMTIDDIIIYDKKFINPDYVFLIKGDHLHLRNEKQELYHKNKAFNNILLNNYILSLQHLNTSFAIIYNTYGKLNESVLEIVNIINSLTIQGTLSLGSN
jgi:thymidylate kinase